MLVTKKIAATGILKTAVAYWLISGLRNRLHYMEFTLLRRRHQFF